MSQFEQWIGRTRTMSDVLDPARCNALDRTLGGAGGLAPGDTLPPLYHWLHFWDVVPPAGLGTDGHPAKGDFLPPVPLPRRMWAGGRISFLKPLRLGMSVTRTSTITAVSEKTGRTGPLVFVTLRHELEGGEGLALSEEQDLVYREPAAGMAPAPAPQPAPLASWVETVNPDPVLLFRYSALTMNGHRIHYDLPYARDEEAYPALVVHGPLQATLLAQLAASRLDRPITAFEFRGERPAFCGAVLHVCGEPDGEGGRLWTQQGDAPAMTATVHTG